MKAARLTRAILVAFLASLVFTAAALAQAPTATGALPKDVYPESRFRLPLPNRAERDDYGKQVYDQVVNPNSPSLAGLQGPAGILLGSPKIAAITNEANDYLRKGTGFGDRLTEITILTTAREMENQFEWTAHEKAGLKAGVEPTIIDIIKFRKPVAGLNEKEAVTIEFGRELFAQRKVSPGTFATALRLYGRRGLVDLVSLMGQYASMATLLNAFDMQLPEGQKPLLPLP